MHLKNKISLLYILGASCYLFVHNKNPFRVVWSAMKASVAFSETAHKIL